MSEIKAKNYCFPRKMAICVIFHFNKERLCFLDLISRNFNSLAESVSVCIVTNTSKDSEIEQIDSVLSSNGVDYFIYSEDRLGHPYLLPWSHFVVFRRLFEDKTITHFMYLEDDILINKNNIMYWVYSRELLRPFNLIPSFLRVEKKDTDGKWYCTDVTKKINIIITPKVIIDNDYCFLNMSNPYQGMYLLDRELMYEHLNGESSSPDYGIWLIREKSSQGVTFLNVPKGYNSRNLVGYNKRENKIDKNALIHHTPNNYANNRNINNRFATLSVENLITGVFLYKVSSVLSHIYKFMTSSTSSKTVGHD